MADISAEAVRKLRELTDLPMMMCKKALTEAAGDQAKAIDILRQEAGKVLLKRAENATSEGRIFIEFNDDCSKASMVELQCESAPVSKNDSFCGLGTSLAKQLLKGPGAESADTLLDQSVGGSKLRDTYEELVNKIREKIVVARVIRVDGPVGGYVHHDGKTGVLFQAEGKGDCTTAVLRDVAMHIAALRPVATKPEDLDPAKVQAERDKLSEQARKSGKPENIIAKIVDGQMNKFYVDEGVLVNQPFAKDDSKSVSQALAEQGLKAKTFTRWVLGTGA